MRAYTIAELEVESFDDFLKDVGPVDDKTEQLLRKCWNFCLCQACDAFGDLEGTDYRIEKTLQVDLNGRL